MVFMNKKIVLIAVFVMASLSLVAQAGARAARAQTLLPTPTLAVPPAPTVAQPEALAQTEPPAQPTGESVVPLPPPTDAPVVTDPWLPPANLSRSGATSAPQIAVDNGGRYHVLWQDAIDGFAYSFGDGTIWSPPGVVEAPFSTRRFLAEDEQKLPTPRFNPWIVGDRDGYIHAFWSDSHEEGPPILYHSAAPAGRLADFDAWSPREQIDTGVVQLDAALDNAGNLHVAYIRAQEDGNRQAGIYYNRRDPSGGWSGAVPLYISRYLRAVDRAVGNVQVLTTPEGLVLVGWDDTGREQVGFIRSADGGRSWDAPQEIDRRGLADSQDAVGPGGLALGATPGALALTWRAGHEPGQICTQYFRSSTDGGLTWSISERLNDNLPDCLATAQFFTNEDQLLLLGTTLNDLGQGRSSQRAYLLAWNGRRWSNPQEQNSLTAFLNEETNQPVDIRCLTGVAAGGQLGVIGCDQGVGIDVWWRQRPIGTLTDWFPPPSVWVGPQQIAGSPAVTDGLQAVADNVGGTHIFWQAENGQQIFHARWDGAAWSPATPVLASSAGPIAEFNVTSNNGRLYLIWRDGAGLKFAQAGAERPTDWTAPQELRGVSASAVAPAILAASNGDLLLAYTVPLNEDRGVYLLRSTDLGTTWSAPERLFDAAAAGWDMVDRPALAQSGDAVLHALFTRRGLPPNSAPLDLGYARSEDGGRSWSIVDDNFANRAEWSDVFATGERVVHRLWTETVNERTVIWHAYSPDSGVSWSEPEQFAGLPAGQLPAAAVDVVGRLQVVGMEGDRLVNWYWDGSGWSVGESLTTVLQSSGEIAAAADANGRLIVAVSGLFGANTTNETVDQLFGLARPLDLPVEALPTPLPPPATAVPTQTPEPTTTPEPTPTIVISTAQTDNPLSIIPGASGRSGQMALAIFPAGLVVLVVVFIGLRAMRMGRK